MTEITNPPPGDPGGASTMNEQSTLVGGSHELLDGGSTGTEEGPAGIPAALVGRDKAGDEVPKVDPTSREHSGVADQADALSPADTNSPGAVSGGRGEAAASSSLPASHEGR